MPDVLLFLAGLFVTTMVGGAIALLMYGASHEPGSETEADEAGTVGADRVSSGSRAGAPVEA